jgi:aminoglycoside 3-N-acetyltransferase
VGEAGALAMPAFSQNYPGMVEEPYDPATSASTAGRITEAFRKMPGVLRSDNPCHSIAAVGPGAAELTAPHGNYDMFDRHGPFGRLYDLDAWIIMVGCSLAANTMLHAVEAWALPYPPPNFVYARDERGGIKEVVCHDFPEWHREWYGKAEEGRVQKRLFDRGVIGKLTLGRGVVYAMRARPLVDTCLEILKQEPDVFLCHSTSCVTCNPCRAMLVGWHVPDSV